MAPTVPIGAYFRWHYTKAYADLLGIWKDLLWFGYHFFSVPVLLRTLISPFYRIRERPTKFDIEEILESLVTNILMRIVGFLVRIVLLILGGLFLFFLLITGSFVLLIWTITPFLVTALFILGILSSL